MVHQHSNRGQIGKLGWYAAWSLWIGLGVFLAVWGYGPLCHARWLPDHRHLQGAYTVYSPYSFYEDDGGRLVVKGLDVEMLQKTFSRMGYSSTYRMMIWSEQLRALEAGELDFVMGAFKTPEREQYAHFSARYRDQIDQIYMRSDTSWDPHMRTWDAVVQALEANQLTVGVVIGAVYAHAGFQAFLAAHPDQVIWMHSEQQALLALDEGKLGAAVMDRIAGSSLLAHMELGRQVVEAPVPPVTRPVYVMFSRKHVTTHEVEAFNQALQEVQGSGLGKRIKRHYILPVFTHITTDSSWFYAIEILAIVALAIPGLIIARSQGYDIFGAWILAAMPGLGGGVLRDLLVGRHPLFLFTREGYLLSVVGVWALFAVLSRLSQNFYQESLNGFSRPYFLGGSIWGMGAVLIGFFDALGYAAFTVVGVVVAIQMGAEPLWLWGPTLAVVTVSTGGILRDLIGGRSESVHIKGGLVPEFAFIWGFLLAQFLIWETDRLHGTEIMWGLVATLVGMFISQVAAFYYHWTSPRY